MNWEVFTRLSTFQIQLHWVFATGAFFLGLLILARKKGTGAHVVLGRVWVGAMVVVALSALFISEIAPSDSIPTMFGFSPIHLFVPFTFVMLYFGVLSARQKNFKRHKGIMLGTFFGSLVIAGAFTFAPGRHMHTLFFGEAEQVKLEVQRSAQE